MNTKTRVFAASYTLLLFCLGCHVAHSGQPAPPVKSDADNTAGVPAQPAGIRHKRTHPKPAVAAQVPELSPLPAKSAVTAQPAHTSDSPAIGAFMLPAILIGSLIYAFRGRNKTRTSRIDALAAEAQAWMEHAKSTGKLPSPDTGSLIIPNGERALLAEPSSLYELRVDSTRHYLGTRVKVGKIPFYVGSSKNVSKKILKSMSSGTLALTDRGLIFAGSARTAKVKVSDIVGVEPTVDSIVVNSGARAAPFVFAVQNPFTWFLAIKLVASGDLKVET